MKAFLSTDMRQCNQSDTVEEFEEEQLLESLCEKFAERYMAKQAAAAARRKEKEDKDSLRRMKQKEQAGWRWTTREENKLDLEKI